MMSSRNRGLPRWLDLSGLVLLLATLTLPGCNGARRPTLVSSLTLATGWSRLAESARQVLRDPKVWAPLAAAVVLQAGDLDVEISDQLRDDTPVYGSTQNALDASDDLRSLSEIAYAPIALLAPGPESSSDWLLTKSALLGPD